MKMVSRIASSIIDKFCLEMSGYYPGEYRQRAIITSDYMVLRDPLSAKYNVQPCTPDKSDSIKKPCFQP